MQNYIILNFNVVFNEFLLNLYSKIKKIMISLSIFLFVGPWQYIVIGLAILLLFGGKKIPELMKGLGGGIKEFKKATKEEEEETKKVDDSKE